MKMVTSQQRKLEQHRLIRRLQLLEEVYTYKTQVTVKEKEVETPKVSITATLKGNAGKTVTTIKDVKAGDALPAWNKAKYKAAGKKGYVFAGWTYNGKIVTKMPESDKEYYINS